MSQRMSDIALPPWWRVKRAALGFPAMWADGYGPAVGREKPLAYAHYFSDGVDRMAREDDIAGIGFVTLFLTSRALGIRLMNEGGAYIGSIKRISRDDVVAVGPVEGAFGSLHLRWRQAGRDAVQTDTLTARDAQDAHIIHLAMLTALRKFLPEKCRAFGPDQVS